MSQPWLVEAVGNAEWTGTPLAPLLREAGLSDDAVDVVFTGADHGVERGVEQDYQRALPVADALREEVLLAYEMNGAPLLPQHGAPLRLIVPGWYGMAHVKWLRDITVTTEPFDGYQNAVAYRLRRDADDPGVPVTRIEPRALVRPPGFPDFMSRTRVLRPGPCTLDGRAWSGHAPVTSVEVTVDGGETWTPAVLDGPAGASGRGAGGRSGGRRRRGGTCSAPGRPTRRGVPSRSSSRGTGAGSRTTWCSGSRWSCRRSDPRAFSRPWSAPESGICGKRDVGLFELFHIDVLERHHSNILDETGRTVHVPHPGVVHLDLEVDLAVGVAHVQVDLVGQVETALGLHHVGELADDVPVLR